MNDPEHADQHDNGRPNSEALMGGIGRLVRSLRRDRRLTLEVFAQKSGLSTGVISQLERGKGNPSFNTLVQIAHALDVPIGRLFNSVDATSPVVRAGERRALDIHQADPGDATHELLTPSLNGALESVWIEAPPGYDTSGSPFIHNGEEFGIVLEGRHEVYLDGERYELGPGDSITYSSAIPHWYRNPGPDPVKALWVITPPTF
ncbi:XRE family transcriptional regulator [Actinomadura vinacea]|uniref:XRE family transcriptional regulator n=1 Tax=Actinomadura vinacea TaxID=115336 RepID=A0ABN3JPD6_9ACTN